MDWDAPAALLFGVLGQAATYRTATGTAAVTVIVRRDLQLEPDGFQAQAATRQMRIELRVAEVGDVGAIRRGETVEVEEDGACYTVERVEADDGIRVRLLCYLSE